MILKTEQDLTCSDIEVLIRYAKMNKRVQRLMNSRMEATLKNGERLYITRKYLSGIKKALQEGVEM